MLVVTRRRREAVMIGDGIEVRVLRVGRDGVRLGITAPADVPVHRLEVYEQIRAENLSAARAATTPETLLEQLRKRKRVRSEQWAVGSAQGAGHSEE